MRFVIFQVNSDFLINHLTKNFYTRHLAPLSSFQKICAVHRRCFQNHPLFTNFSSNVYLFSQWKTCAIFQINTKLIIKQNINFFTQETLYLSFISKNKLALSITNVFRNIHFGHFFTIVKRVSFVIFQVNADILII